MSSTHSPESELNFVRLSSELLECGHQPNGIHSSEISVPIPQGPSSEILDPVIPTSPICFPVLEMLTASCRYYMYVSLFQCSNNLCRASLVAQMVKNLSAVQETQVQSLGREDPLEKGMTIHSSILDWRIPGTEVPDGLSPWGPKE